MFSKKLINKYYRYAYSLCGDQELAYDMLHDVIERLIRNGNTEDIKDSYMYNALRNRSIDHWRKETKRKNESIDEVPLVELSTPSFEDVIVDKDQMSSILGQISQEEQSLLFLHLVEGYTVQEIADHLQKPKGTILSKIHRIKAKLKSIVNIDGKKKGEIK